MGDKNKHVIIGYFPGDEEAKKAADQIKKWDKASKDIKLGGIGILTMKKGNIKTRKVGRRAGGTGAKWGMALGAATGILSGGVTLIGGAVAGAAGGAVMGAMFHKSLGLTDADKKRLEQHLQDGGAALIVMADEKEVNPTKAEMAGLGGRVEDYQVPEETMDQVEKSTDVEPVADEDKLLVLGKGGPLKTVEGIGSARAAALAGVGITTTTALLERGATQTGRADIASQSKISEKLIGSWVSAIDLSRVSGVGAQYGELLQAAGVTKVGDLAQQDATSFHKQLVTINGSKKLVREVPGVSRIEKWIIQAKELPEVVKN
jgi:uncharacterized membrane protein